MPIYLLFWHKYYFMKIDYNKYPLSLLESFKQHRYAMRKLCKEHNDIIVEEQTDLFLTFKFKHDFLNGYYNIYDLKLDKGKKYFFVNKRPSNRDDNSVRNLMISEDAIEDSFKNWIDLIKGFKDFSLDDEIEEEYEEEFYNQWKFIDDDADLKPFQLHQQIFILQFLNAADSLLENKEINHDIEDIKKDIITINENITKFSKNTVIKYISRITAKGFKHSKKLGLELLTELKKHIFKELISNGSEYIQKLIEGFTAN